MGLFLKSAYSRELRSISIAVFASVGLAGTPAGVVHALSIVVGHDINTLGSFVAGDQEETFAVNVANFLTDESATKNLLLFESNPGDGTRDFSTGVLDALSDAGFSVTVTADYTTPFETFDAIFVAQDFPTVGFLDNDALINYVNTSGGVYLAGGVGLSPAIEAQGWSTFLNNFGLEFVSSNYNGLNNVTITSTHPIFAGITSLGSGNGQSIIDLGTNPNAQIVQFANGQGVYAVVEEQVIEKVPEPSTLSLIVPMLLSLALLRRRISSEIKKRYLA